MEDLEPRLADVRRLGVDGPEATAAAETLERLADELQARLQYCADRDTADVVAPAGADATS